MTRPVIATIFMIILIHSGKQDDTPEETVRIGIIGAGMSGTSTAYFLRQLLPNVKVDVYEDRDVGGRMATVSIGNREYEAGGSVIHRRNNYMVNFTQTLGLHKAQRLSGTLGIYDGSNVVFDGSSYKLMMAAQFLWHYGFDLYTMDKHISKTLDSFARIYEHQEKGYSFTSVEQLLRSMDPDFVDLLHHSLLDDLHQAQYSENFITQVVRGALRNNYGQDENVHAFVGSVSMAGFEPGLWSIHGGNKKVPEKLLEISSDKVHLIRAKATAVNFDESESIYTIETADGEEREYDYVVIATPLDTASSLSFDGFPEGSDFHYNLPYQRTVSTFIKGVPNFTKFGYSEASDFPADILTCNNSLFFNSIGRPSPIDFLRSQKEQYLKSTVVYKVFSAEPLTEEQISELFTDVEEVKIVDWLAYPQYSDDEQEIPPFQLHHGLFYTSAIELAASAMEMSAIAGRNVALLIKNFHLEQSSLVDPYFEKSGKDEL